MRQKVSEGVVEKVVVNVVEKQRVSFLIIGRKLNNFSP